MKIYPISLGCAKNKVDLEVLLGNLLSNPNTSLTDDIKKSDLILVNTCAFIESAKKEAIETILDCVDMKKRTQKIVVTGCLSTRYDGELEELFPEVDRFITIKEYPKLDEIINSLFKNHPFTEKIDPLQRFITTGTDSVYVKISEGCNHRCHYCAIPLIRGPFVARDKDEIIQEVKNLSLSGAKEINLISQDTTMYGFGKYKDYGIVELLDDLCQIEGDFKLRLLYLYPNLVSDKLIDFIATHDKVMPYFDIPLQHSEDKMLFAMNRKGDKAFISNLLDKIRTKIPNAILRTTMIVGYPGETDEDFSNLLSFIKDHPFDRLGAFTYSPEEGTVGYTLPQIDDEVKESRLEALYLVQDEIATKLNKAQIGTIHETLIESYNEEEYCYYGRSYAFAPDDIDGAIIVYAKDEIHVGDVVKVKILDADTTTLTGEVVF